MNPSLIIFLISDIKWLSLLKIIGRVDSRIILVFEFERSRNSLCYSNCSWAHISYILTRIWLTQTCPRETNLSLSFFIILSFLYLNMLESITSLSWSEFETIKIQWNVTMNITSETWPCLKCSPNCSSATLQVWLPWYQCSLMCHMLARWFPLVHGVLSFSSTVEVQPSSTLITNYRRS